MMPLCGKFAQKPSGWLGTKPIFSVSQRVIEQTHNISLLAVKFTMVLHIFQ
jgi:hypothetical protein